MPSKSGDLHLVCARSKALADCSISVAKGAVTLDPTALCFLRWWTAPWPRLCFLRLWTGLRLLLWRLRLRRMRFAAFLHSNWRRRRCRHLKAERRHGLGCRKLIRFWRRRTVVLRWRLHGLCWLVQVRFAARARKAHNAICSAAVMSTFVRHSQTDTQT